MKKTAFGLTAIIMAITVFAFANVKQKTGEMYWFPLNRYTGAALALSQMPTYSTTDPTACSIGPMYCEGGFSSFSKNSSGDYFASGIEEVVDFDME